MPGSVDKSSGNDASNMKLTLVRGHRHACALQFPMSVCEGKAESMKASSCILGILTHAGKTHSIKCMY